jgi:hypothetical protein
VHEPIPCWPAKAVLAVLLAVHVLAGVTDLVLFLVWGSKATVSAEVQRLWHEYPGFLFLVGLLAGHLFLTK